MYAYVYVYVYVYVHVYVYVCYYVYVCECIIHNNNIHRPSFGVRMGWAQVQSHSHM